MTKNEIHCLIRLPHTDLVMQNHRVHGVSILPGVVLLDMVIRVLVAKGYKAHDYSLERILFSKPVATDVSVDKEMLVEIKLPSASAGSVRVTSRPCGSGSAYIENMRAILVEEKLPSKPRIDVSHLKANAEGGLDMAEMYRRARAEEIKHGPKMRCIGQLWVSNSQLIAELKVEVPGVNGFYMHPAALDATTIAAYGQTELASREPFIPVTIDKFRILFRLPEQFILHAPNTEILSSTGEVISNSYDLYDSEGRYCASFEKLTCKRIRSPELITRLLVDNTEKEMIDSVTITEPTVIQNISYSDQLRRWIGSILGIDNHSIRTDVGFYELGLDSQAMLGLASKLEEIIGTQIYPTLLFEYPDITSLEEYLTLTFGPLNSKISLTPGDDQPESNVSMITTIATPGWLKDKRIPLPELAVQRVMTVGLNRIEFDLLQQTLDSKKQLFAHEEGIGGGIDMASIDTIILFQSASEGEYYTTQLSVIIKTIRMLNETKKKSQLIIVERGEKPSTALKGAAAFLRCVRTESSRIASRTLLVPLKEWAIEVANEIDCSTEGLPVTAGIVSRNSNQGAMVQVLGAGQPIDVDEKATSALEKDSVCVITGGTGSIGQLLTEWLLDEFDAKVILLSRLCPKEDIKDKWGYHTGSGIVRFYECDITNLSQLEEVLEDVRQKFGGIQNIFHIAGSLGDDLHFNITEESIKSVVAPKVEGFRALDIATAKDKLSVFLSFSSLASWRPNPGQGTYAFANAILEGLTNQRNNMKDRSGRTMCIAWPLWADGGMRLSETELNTAMHRTGLRPLTTSNALRCLNTVIVNNLNSTSYHDISAVLYGDDNHYLEWIPSENDLIVEQSGRINSLAEEIPINPSLSTNNSEIAIIGLSGQYPGVDDIDIFWSKLITAYDAIIEIPDSRWNHKTIYDSDRDAIGKTYGRWGGFLKNIDLFDANFFHISRRDAERMDPQERLFLQTSWTLLEEAGYPNASLKERNVGVFVGVMWNHYQLCGKDNVAPTAMHAAIANRVSFSLNLQGPSMAVDTACSSSLTALNLAVDAIHTGACSMAIAGGVNLCVHEEKYLQLAQGQFLSEDGKCRSFGKNGTGYVPGEGVGAVLLRPLVDAIENGDHIWGVIKSCALNHAGRTSGFSVPSPVAQAKVIEKALTRGNIDPSSIDYIEAHGTGTALGDPIEIEGLSRALKSGSKKSIPIGSVKSNIGHLESAAGIAALTKVLLMLRERTLVPSLHAEQLNPALQLDKLGLYVPKDCTVWQPQNDRPLRAAISAFGAGGANAHVIVDQAPDSLSNIVETSLQLFVISSRDERGLREYASRIGSVLLISSTSTSQIKQRDTISNIANYLNVDENELQKEDTLRSLGIESSDLFNLKQYLGLSSIPDLDTELGTLLSIPTNNNNVDLNIIDVAYTLQLCRTHLSERLAVIASTLAEAGKLFIEFSNKDKSSRVFVNNATGNSTQNIKTYQSIAEKWVQGEEVDFSIQWADGVYRKIHLPVTSLRQDRYWIGRWQADTNVTKKLENTVVDEPKPIIRTVADSIEQQDTNAPSLQNILLGNDMEYSNRSAEPVTLKILTGGVALVKMQDSTQHNMFTEALISGLEEIFSQINSNNDIRSVVLTGTSKVFSLGGTPEALERLARKEGSFTDVPFLYEGLLQCKVPVIAAICGHASGGGLTFGLHADQVILDRSGTYSANFVKFGFTPGLGATYVLGQRFGTYLANEMCMTGARYIGKDLEAMGVSVRFADKEDVLPQALQMAQSIAENSVEVVRALKDARSSEVLKNMAKVIEQEVALHDKVLNVSLVPDIRSRTETVPLAASPLTAVTTSSINSDSQHHVNQDTIQRINTTIETTLCNHLFMKNTELNRSLTFNEMGVDSLGAVEIVRDLNRDFGLNLDSVLIYEHPTVEQLVEVVSKTIGDKVDMVSEALTNNDPVVLTDQDNTRSQVSVDKTKESMAMVGSDYNSLQSVTTNEQVNNIEDRNRHTNELQNEKYGNGSKISVDQSSKTFPAPLILKIDKKASSGTAAVNHNNLIRTEPTSSDLGYEDVAIIGMSAYYPDSNNIDEFWENLKNGKFSVTEVTEDRWDVSKYFNPDQHAPGKTNSKWAGLINNVDRFDAAFFGISPREVELMDPQQRIFLEQAWKALEHSGYAIGPDRRINCGVFVGTATGDYFQLLRDAGVSDSGQVFLGNSGSILAGRIAYFLNMGGPTVAIDTACSSSMVALHLACQSIQGHDCDMALAGGVALMITPQMHIWNGKSGMLSPKGRCASFSDSADGFVLGEGVGTVILKRLSKAMEDRDTIHAVIKSSGINGDGKTNGIAAPSAEAQARLLRRVHEKSRVSIDDVAYIETHGAGTQLGDPLEVKALSSLMSKRSPNLQPCGIGSIKSNIGHTSLAGGIAGLLKVVLGLKHGVIPPSLHFESLNSKIDLSNTPIEIVTKTRPWPAGPSGLRCGAVNSFGVSGTNSHAVLTEAPELTSLEPTIFDEAYLLPLSAKTPKALRQILENLLVEFQQGISIEDAAFTLSVGRALFKKRMSLIAKDKNEAISILSDILKKDVIPDIAIKDASIQLLEFSSLKLKKSMSYQDLATLGHAFTTGVDIDFHEYNKDRGGRRIPMSGYPLNSRRYWVPDSDNRIDSKNKDKAQLPVPKKKYDATLVDKEAKREQNHIVSTTLVDTNIEWISDHIVQGKKMVPGATLIYYSLLTQQSMPIRLSEIEWTRPITLSDNDILQIQNTRDKTDRYRTTISFDGHICAQAYSSVNNQVKQSVILDVNQYAVKCRMSIDHDSLYKMFSKVGIDYGVSYQNIERVVHNNNDIAVGWFRNNSHNRKQTIQIIDGILQVVAALESQQGNTLLLPRCIDYLDINSGIEKSALVVVERVNKGIYNLTACDEVGIVTVKIVGFQLAISKRRQAKAYTPVWKPISTQKSGNTHSKYHYMSLHNQSEFTLPIGIGHGELILDARGISDEDPERALQTIRILFTVLDRDLPDSNKVILITAGVTDVTGTETRSPIQAAICNMSRSAAAEHSSWALQVIDFEYDSEPDENMLPPRVQSLPNMVAYRKGQYYERQLIEQSNQITSSPFKNGLTYLIVGGAGGIGFALSEKLASEYGAKIGWIGRRPLDNNIREKIKKIEQLGGKVCYEVGDLGQPKSINNAVRSIRGELGPISGAVHSAIVLDDTTIARMSKSNLERVLEPKLGIRYLYDALEGEPLDHLILFSSIVTFIDSPGQGNYAAASAFLDTYGLELRRRYGVPTYIVNWGYWGSIGVVANNKYSAEMVRRGVGSIEPIDGFKCLFQQIALGLPQTIVLNADQKRFVEYGLKMADSQITKQIEFTEVISNVKEQPSPVAPITELSLNENMVQELQVTLDYVRNVFSSILKMDTEELDIEETFESFGVDSLLGMDILRMMKDDCGELPSTLLYEQLTITEIAKYLFQHHRETVPTVVSQRLTQDTNQSKYASQLHVENTSKSKMNLQPIDDNQDSNAIVDYVRNVFSSILKMDTEELDVEETFESFGVDSILGMDILRMMKDDCGELPSTLLYEQLTITQIASYLFQHHRETVPTNVGLRSAQDTNQLNSEIKQTEKLKNESNGVLPELTPKKESVSSYNSHLYTQIDASDNKTFSEANGQKQTVPKSQLSNTIFSINSNETKIKQNDIAIVGLVGRYPQSPNLEAFWDNLRNGIRCITEVPEGRWDWKTYFDSTPKKNHTYNKLGGFIENIDQFDPKFFGILPSDAVTMDPQERLFLELCWELLEQAGHNGSNTREVDTGVFVGVMYGAYGQIAAAQGWPIGEFGLGHSPYWSIANRVSYQLNFKGPSLAVDTACSSSLTSFHLACESLRSGECRQAITGGVNLILHPSHHIALSSMNMLGTGTACRTFNVDADGIVPGEGVGAALLRPLEDAIADGDDIWGIVKGSMTNAGGKTSGYTVPNPNAQSEVIRRAIKRAGVEPKSIGYVEVHGTGTQLGDPIEITGLNKVFENEKLSRPVYVGSVKSNIGHLEGAAGIAGITKAILQLRHGEIVPCAGLDELNTKIKFSKAVQPARDIQTWNRRDVETPQTSGVSSFGAGGANAHVILESWMDIRDRQTTGKKDVQLFLLSANNYSQLKKYAYRVAEWLGDHTGADIQKLCYTSQIGRRELRVRLSVVATSIGQLVQDLSNISEQDESNYTTNQTNTTKLTPPSKTFTIPFGGLADELINLLIQNRKLTEIGEAWVHGCKVNWSLLWDALPGIASFPTVPFEHRRFWFADNSDYSANNASRLNTDQWYTILAKDHRIHQRQLVPGAALLEILTGNNNIKSLRALRWLQPCDLNQDDVISLQTESDGDRIRAYKVGTKEPLAVATKSNTVTETPNNIDIASLKAVCTKTINRETFYNNLNNGGFEYGPLLQLVTKVVVGNNIAIADLKLTNIEFKHHGARIIDAAMQVVTVLTNEGPAIPIGLSVFNKYLPFPNVVTVIVKRDESGSVYNLTLCSKTGSVIAELEGLRLSVTHNDVISSSVEQDREIDLGFTEYLRSVNLPLRAEGLFTSPEIVLILTENNGPISGLIKSLKQHNVQQVVTSQSVENHAAVNAMILLLTPSEQSDYVNVSRYLKQLRDILMWAKKTCNGNGLRLLVVGDEEDIAAKAVSAATRTLALEHTWLQPTQLFVSGLADHDNSNEIIEELLLVYKDDMEITRKESQRYTRVTQSFIPNRNVKTLLRPGGIYLITGGNGALGKIFALHLMDYGPISIVLIGRSPETKDLTDWMATKNNSGRFVTYRKVDITDNEEVEKIITELSADLGAIRGIIHTAGIQKDGLAINKSDASIDEVLDPKIKGVNSIDLATIDQPLDFFLVCSSLAAETGNIGQFDYSAANRYLVHYVEKREILRNTGKRKGISVSVQWPLWAQGAMSVDVATEELFIQRYQMMPMPSEAGLKAFDFALSGNEESFSVVQRPIKKDTKEKSVSIVSVSASSKKNELELKVDVDLIKTMVAEELCGIGAEFLLVEPKDVDADIELLELGFDSISLTSMVNKINSLYMLDLLPTILFEFPTLNDVAGYLATEYGKHISDLKKYQPISELTSTQEIKNNHAIDSEESLSNPQSTTNSNNSPMSEPIAIVGIAGRLASASSLREFWDALINNKELITEPGQDHDALRRDPDTAKIRGGFLTDVASFDAELFGISPREANLMDPQQRLFLEAVYEAVQDAGYCLDAWEGKDVGLFAGVATSDYDNLLVESNVKIESHIATGIAHSILANRVSHIFDWQGPSEVVDTACSSSLVALNRAVKALRNNECEIAIIGGVNVTLSPGLFKAFNESGMLSANYLCRTFDSKADGYVRGEGVGAAVLRSLSDAQANGDHIYAVVRGSAVNHCGKSASLTAPNPTAQANVIYRAIVDADIDPRSISFIETHGTGTPLGDPIEIEGLKQAYVKAFHRWDISAHDDSWISLGAVKTVVGHLEAAAGMAGLFRTILSLDNGYLTANRNYSENNPYIRLKGSPFKLLTENRNWDNKNGTRRAGVSSFGFGGTNAHVILEAAPDVVDNSDKTNSDPVWQLFPLSARSSDNLCQYATVLVERITSSKLRLKDIAYTLQNGRSILVHRVVVVARTHAELVDKLKQIASDTKIDNQTIMAETEVDHESIPSDLFALAKQWVIGGVIEWPDSKSRRCSLPVVPLIRTRHWFSESKPIVSATVDSDSKVNVLPQNIDPDDLLVSENASVSKDINRSNNSKVTLTTLQASLTSNSIKPTNYSKKPNPTHQTARNINENQNTLTVNDEVPPISVTKNDKSPDTLQFILEKLSKILLITIEKIDPTKLFDHLGLDSIFRMDLVKMINEQFKIELKGEELYKVDGPIALGILVDSLITAKIQKKDNRHEEQTLQIGGNEIDNISVFCELVTTLTGHQLSDDSNFIESGLTSFDMLKVIAELETVFGPLPKILLFENPTPVKLTYWLDQQFDTQLLEVLVQRLKKDNYRTMAEWPTEQLNDGAAVIAKRNLADHPEIEESISTLNEKWSKEGGLPGRDIAPLIFLGSNNCGFLNFTERDGLLLAWSFAVPEVKFTHLVEEWVEWALSKNYRPNLFSMLPLEKVAKIDFCSTSFGTVQRLYNIKDFSIKGKTMRRLRKRLQKFEKSGEVKVEEYVIGSESTVDDKIVTLIDEWVARKDMVNPYVETVRSEISLGIMAERHRVFLTFTNDEIVAVVVVTKIPSENGYLLDLEFFGDNMANGGLDFTIVEIIYRLASEGCDLFSFGATLGVVLTESPNPHPEVEYDLNQLRETGIFNGYGNYQFKNKYRPENIPIYLCHPATTSSADVTSLLLLIINPTIDNNAVKLKEPVDDLIRETKEEVQGESPVIVPEVKIVTTDIPRQVELRQVGWNAMSVPRSCGPFDLVTDSWAERDDLTIINRMRELSETASSDCQELSEQSTLPFEYIYATSSGRMAEAALLRAIGHKKIIIQNNLFPSWTFNALDLGFQPETVRTLPHSADIDLTHLASLLKKCHDTAGLCCIELSPNSVGGLPLSLENAREVSSLVHQAGIPLIFDATRGLDNVAMICETEQKGDFWDVANELYSLATAMTLSMSKNFGVSSGGLIVTSNPTLIHSLRNRIASRGEEVSLTERRLLAAALADKKWLEGTIRNRIHHTNEIGNCLIELGVSIHTVGGHAILIDAKDLCGNGYVHPVASTLAWLYETVGLRAAPHLNSNYKATENCIRLAVPVGLNDDDIIELKKELKKGIKTKNKPENLVRITTRNETNAFYQPRDEMPDDVADAIDEGACTSSKTENWSIVKEWQPAIHRRMVPYEGDLIEVFEVGEGTPIVFLHPFNIGLGFFAPQMKELAKSHKVIGIHAPGVGMTTAATDLSFAGLAKMVITAVKGIGVTIPFTVVGASFGGLTAISLALRHPKQIAGLILLGSSYKIGNRKGEVNRLTVVAREDFDTIIAAGANLTQPREVFESLLQRGENMESMIGLRYLDVFAHKPNLLNDIADLNVPTLIVHGKHDTVINVEVAKLIHKTIPDSRFIEIPDAGHFPSLTCPEKINTLITEFTKEIQGVKAIITKLVNEVHN